MKKLKQVLVVALLLMSSAAVGQQGWNCGKPAEGETEATDAVIATLDENGVFSISGEGEMKDYYYSPWSYYAINKVVIKEGVTSIGSSAFSGCNLAQVTIPSSVTSIGDTAFFNCRNLENFIVTKGNTKYVAEDGVLFNIDKTTLIQCPAKKSGEYTIPSWVTSIEEFAFYGCRGLTQVTIPSSVTSIGSYAFFDCTSLTDVTIPNSVTSIESNAFSFCSRLAQVTIPSSVTSIGYSAFYGCSALEYFTITNPNPANVRIDAPFGGMSNCKLKVPTGSEEAYKTAWVEYIGEGKPFTSVVTYEGKVWNCGKPAEGETEATDAVIATLDENGVLSISGEGEMKEYYYGGTPWYSYSSSIVSLSISDGITSIGSDAFSDCKFTGLLTIPSSVTSIGSSAFYGCQFDTVKVFWKNPPKSVEQAFYKGSVKVFSVPPCTKHKYEDFWLYMCCLDTYEVEEQGECEITPIGGIDGSLTWSIENGTLTIGGQGKIDYNDYGKLYPWEEYIPLIKNIVIEKGITSIGSGCFSDYNSLTSVFIPSSLTMIDAVGADGTDSPFFNCKDLTAINVDINNPTYNSENGILYNKEKTELLRCPEGKDSAIVSNTVKSIGKMAFIWCSNLTFVSIPNSVEDLGFNPFHGCSSLKTVEVFWEEPILYSYLGTDILSVPEGTKEIYQSASGWKELTIIEREDVDGDFVILSSGLLVKYKGNGGNVFIPNTVTSIAAGVFQNKKNIILITIPNSVTSIGSSAFSGCSGLAQVTIPNSVTSIESNAFSFCSRLAQVTIPNSVTSIGSSAFYNCDALDTLVTYWVEAWEIPNLQISAKTVLSVPAGTKMAYQTKYSNNKIVERGIASYTVEITAGEGGIVGGSNSYVQFTICTALAMAREGYTFVNWIENGTVVSRSESYTFQVTQDRTLQAVFVENQSSNVDVSEIEIPADKGVAVTVEADNAVVAWKAKDNAAGYTLVIKDASGENVICSLEFDSEGKLVGLSFGSALRSTSETFGFKVTNLAENTTYKYTLKTFDADDEVIDSKEGEFTTKSGGDETAIPNIETAPATVVGYYNLMGQRLNGKPAQGIYIILYSNGTSQKVFSSIQ